jgi:putative hydrolase of the HAD superfamily
MLWPDLHDYDIARYFAAATCSGDTGHFKPHPAPFERALARLGVTADEAVMVGDSLEADVRGAQALGMRAVWKLNGRYGLPHTDEPHAVIHDLGELLDLPLLGGAGAPHPVSPTPHEDDNEDRY